MPEGEVACMAATIHGHEILHLIVDADPALTRDRLGQVVERRFGTDCRFHTCSAQGMDLEQLLQFLQDRGKIACVDGTLTADPSRICSHD
jgi:probable metal-binding protein